MTTARLRVRVDRNTGCVSFFDAAAGRPILAESTGGHIVESAEVQGEQTFHARQLWQANADESLYGLGQQQKGTLDIKGYDLDMWQHNTNVVVPLLVSSRGYGIFWDNMSYSRFGDLRPFTPIPAENFSGLTMTPMDGSTPPATVSAVEIGRAPGAGRGGARPRDTRWEGSILAPATGDYQFKTYSNGGIKVWLDNRLVIDHFRQSWLTDDDQVKVHLEANQRYAIKVEWTAEQGSTLRLTWKTPSAEAGQFSLWSEVADGVDYYFVYGPKLDNVVAGYRLLTGQAPMMPLWAFGLWQSRQKYDTAQQSLDVVGEFRKRKIPFDNIVQDWQYWKPDAWGTHQFDASRFPDPNGWIKAIHDLHAHLMISVWGKFYPGSDNFDAMQKAGYLYQPNLQEKMKDWIGFPYTFYDAFNPGARQMFWSQVDKALFQRGIDAWWMDATEPDLTPSPPTLEGQRTHMPQTAMGTGSRVIERLRALQQRGGLRRPAQRGAEPARVHPDPLGFRRNAALRVGHLVGRHHLHLDRDGEADTGGARVQHFRHALLDAGYRRLHHAAEILHPDAETGGRRRMAGVERAVVRIRGVHAAAPGPR